MFLTADDILKLVLAVVIGGLIGAEREFRDKSAGFRTLIFICTGAALFTLLSIKVSSPNGTDPARIAANIVSGVGFLGAGTILRGASEGSVIGLTTAATIWLTAALGMAAGAGEFLLAGAATGVVLAVLWLFPVVEGWIDNLREVRTYEVHLPFTPDSLAQMQAAIAACGLRIKHVQRAKHTKGLVYTWRLVGRPHSHEALVEKLLASPEVESFRY
jgi:putative Mg2+ transporter-C (MgtC) family protein